MATLRADAVRNRELLVDAAAEAFAERGLDIPLEEIAVRAGVGIATLYRRFPTREDLLAAVAERKLVAYEEALEKADRKPDPWSAFAGYVEGVCALQAADGPMADVFTMTFPSAPEFESRRRALFQGYLRLVERAKSAGALREDFSPQDLPMLLMANAGLLRGTAEAAPTAWKRFVAYLLDAFRAGTGAGEGLPAAPSPRQMQRAMLRVTACRGRSSPDAR
jgi:AcrR family transcriptional regulator